jgi:hypothetical protein
LVTGLPSPPCNHTHIFSGSTVYSATEHGY